MAKAKKTPIHYVDNKLLLENMIQYRAAIADWKIRCKQQQDEYQEDLDAYQQDYDIAVSELRNWIPERPPEPTKLRKPQIPKYVAESLVKIANRLSTMPSFAGYPYREEMIGDGIVNCVEYIDNFNPAKSNNPFSYFTQIIYFAFIRRIKKEQKITSIKVKAFDNLILELELEGMGSELQGITSTLAQKRDKTDV